MMRFLVLFLIVYVWAGFVYESDRTLIVLDGRVVDAETKQAVEPTRAVPFETEKARLLVNYDCNSGNCPGKKRGGVHFVP